MCNCCCCGAVGTAGALGTVDACGTAGAVVELVHVGLLILWCRRCTVSDCLCCGAVGTRCMRDYWCSGAVGACGTAGALRCMWYCWSCGAVDALSDSALVQLGLLVQ